MVKKLDDMSKDELIAEIKQLRSRKKYGLIWEDKHENVIEACDKKLPVLTEVADRAMISHDNDSTNLLIEGDNYHALSVLNYTHKGKIDVIYIDPPYNTGAKDWKYNNDYIDKDDAYRHTKWLSFMSHRLRLAKTLLSEKGIICCAIDDYEGHRLGLLLEDIFHNYKHNLIVIKHHGQGSGGNGVSRVHEYVYIFTKEDHDFHIERMPKNNESWSLMRTGQGENNFRYGRPNQFFAILVNKKNKVIDVEDSIPKDAKYPMSENKKGLRRIYPTSKDGKERVWIYNPTTMREKIQKNLVIYTKNNSMKLLKKELIKSPVLSIWDDPKYNAGHWGTKLLKEILPQTDFPYPKSLYTMMDCIKITSSKKDAIILDFFAGSGTTGHAVLELNKEDGGNRQFILCTNNENNIAEEVTYQRIKNVIEGYANVQGIPANLRYFKTSFVEKAKSSDDTRYKLVRKSTDMICVREGTYNKKYDNRDYKIYHNNKHTTGILFNLNSLGEFKNKLTKINMPAHIYVFSLSNDTFDTDFSDLTIKYELIPIPESILAVYRRLFRKNKGKILCN